MRWNLLRRSALGLSVVAGLLVGLLVDSASAQARRSDRNRIVDSTGADVSSLNGARGVPLEAARGPQVQRDYAGSLDARLMRSAIGVDPYSLVAAGLGHGNPTGEKFTSFATMRKLPSIEEVRRGKKRRDNRETVCGTDQRTRVTNTTAAPFRWTCELVITLEDGSQAIGTGWFVGPRCVVTAGHCVHGEPVARRAPHRARRARARLAHELLSRRQRDVRPRGARGLGERARVRQRLCDERAQRVGPRGRLAGALEHRERSAHRAARAALLRADVCGRRVAPEARQGGRERGLRRGEPRR